MEKYMLWLDAKNKIVSFHEEARYEKVEFSGVSQILCKHRRAVKNRAKIICWGGGLSATP